MEIFWTSQKGKQRKRNNDAVAIGYFKETLVAVIVDAAEPKRNTISGVDKKGKFLSIHWADTCLVEILKSIDSLTEKTLIGILHKKQKELRHHFLFETACYGIMIMDTMTGEIQWYYTGDCRLGIQKNKGEPEWLDTPHRIDNLPIFNDFHHGEKDHIYRSLNSRRFFAPEIIKTTLNKKNQNTVILATDGYWHEHLEKNRPLYMTGDDASFLVINHGSINNQIKTDAPNFFVAYPLRTTPIT